MNEAGSIKYSLKIIIALITLIVVSVTSLFIFSNNKKAVETKKSDNSTSQAAPSSKPVVVSKQEEASDTFDCNSERFPVRVADLDEIAGVPYEITSGQQLGNIIICQFAIKQGYETEFSLIIIGYHPNSPESYQSFKATYDETARSTNDKVIPVPGLGDEAWTDEGQTSYLIKKGNSFISMIFSGKHKIGEKVSKLAVSRM